MSDGVSACRALASIFGMVLGVSNARGRRIFVFLGETYCAVMRWDYNLLESSGGPAESIKCAFRID